MSDFCENCGYPTFACVCRSNAEALSAELGRIRMQLMSAGSEIERLTKENAELREKIRSPYWKHQ